MNTLTYVVINPSFELRGHSVVRLQKKCEGTAIIPTPKSATARVAVPCHLRLRARFYIRFKRHARHAGQVRHFSIKSCVLKTRAKPVTKTFH